MIGLHGRPSVRVVGLTRSRFGDVYHRLLTLHWSRFLLLSIALYFGINVVFAGLYLIEPGSIANATPGSFGDAFFFSVETLATIGYGALSPATLYANILMTAEAFCGVAVTALATGLIFARVSRPTARVIFSRHAIVSDLDGVPTFMFRAGNVRANQVLEANVSLNLARNEVTREGAALRRFYDLAPIRAGSPLFALTWTVMHRIDAASPLLGETPESLARSQAEIVVVLSGVDETFAQRIHARHSYLPGEIAWGRRFADVLSLSDEGHRTIDYSRFHDLEP